MAGADPPPEALPVLTFEEGVSLHFNGEEIEVVHFPAAHTDGDAVVFLHAARTWSTWATSCFTGCSPTSTSTPAAASKG